jgi:hypothetical protein
MPLLGAPYKYDISRLRGNSVASAYKRIANKAGDAHKMRHYDASANHFCHEKPTGHSISSVEPCVAVSNTQKFSVTMEKQQLFASALSNYKIYLTAIKNTKVIWSSCKTPDICRILYKFEFYRHILIEEDSTKFHGYPSIKGRVHACEYTDGRTDTKTLRGPSAAYTKANKYRNLFLRLDNNK